MKKKKKPDKGNKKPVEKTREQEQPDMAPSIGSADAFKETEIPRYESSRDWRDEELDDHLSEAGG